MTYQTQQSDSEDPSSSDIDDLEFPGATPADEVPAPGRLESFRLSCLALCGYACKILERKWAEYCCCIPCTSKPDAVIIDSAVADGSRNVLRAVNIYLKDETCRNISSPVFLGFLRANSVELTYRIAGKIERENKKTIRIDKNLGSVNLLSY